ncbi:hypothetical protein [Vibrio aestuarianus]|uniref:Uncharacterized protein n=3 Tax=Vibrio aestuarianus TaxID=28171 RepID=A0ABM9FIU1_9VIBR|nr:hypothetical protein [Vibrio aestuarianus]MDE1213478.1 hypothetical protein [Vibrio aestuarianus]MDE1219137.1 hypothetical protein [Vibrio aestuarianus]MDE1258561.1 hypothetical protein [Vibrio aestuarianus]MDE1260243.1 hypothetical protein [Vibrio aestuarianus]MDE1266817.1 hypothetical protein [Vibrio aestuarianus]
MERGLISFFEVNECGFYRMRNNKDSEHVEGSLTDSLTLVEQWVKSRDFTQTVPWDVESSPLRTQIYCKDIAVNPVSKDALFVLWKRYGDDSGKVKGISPDAKFGANPEDSIKIDAKVKGQSAILGEPMYYWFIPELNVVASINFPHSVASTTDVCNYIKRCIDLRISHPRKKVVEQTSFNQFSNREQTVKRVIYKSRDGKFSMNFKFDVHMKELSSQKANIKNLCKKITHIVVRDTISTVQEDQKDSCFRLFDLIQGKSLKKKFQKQVEIIEERRLSEEELKSMLEVYHQEFKQTDTWNNVGFREDGNDTTRWFNKYVSKEHILMEPLDRNSNFHSAKSLLDELQKSRSDLLQTVISESDESVPVAVGE